VLEVIHSLRFTTVKILHPAYDSIDELHRPSEKSETYCWVNVWSCYNCADDDCGVLFCFPRKAGFLHDDELCDLDLDSSLDASRRDERAVQTPEVAAKAMPPQRSKSQPAAGRSQEPEEFNLSPGRNTEMGDSIGSGRSQGPIFPDGHRPEGGPARPKKMLPQRKTVPPKAAQSSQESVEVAKSGGGVANLIPEARPPKGPPAGLSRTLIEPSPEAGASSLPHKARPPSRPGSVGAKAKTPGGGTLASPPAPKGLCRV
jgi:hypothetical protein